MTITLKKEPVKDKNGVEIDFSLRVIIDTENYCLKKGINFDNDCSQAADDIQDTILGEIARFNWERVLKSILTD